MKILVIQLKQIGDVLLSSPIISSLRRKYPEAVIDYAVYDYTLGVVENNPNIDNFIILNKKHRESKLELFKLLWQIQQKKYDIVIDVLAKIESALLTFFSRAPIRIGYNKRLRKLAYNRIIDQNRERIVSGAGNTIDDRLSLLKALDPDFTFVSDLKIYLNDDEVKNMRNRMIESGIDFSKPVFAFGVTSRRAFRIWPKEYFVELINQLIAKYDCQALFFFTPDEKEYCQSVANGLDKQSNVFTNVYTKNIRELLALLKNSDLYIGNDNGPRHFAQGVETPAFSIFSPYADKWFFNPHNQPKYIAIDYADAAGLDKEEYLKLKKQITKENSMDYFVKIKPEFVFERICDMIKINKIV